jgi:hypothetical protein
MIQGSSDVDLSVTVTLGIDLINDNARSVLGLDDLATDDLFNCLGRLSWTPLEPSSPQPNT